MYGIDFAAMLQKYTYLMQFSVKLILQILILYIMVEQFHPRTKMAWKTNISVGIEITPISNV